MDRSVKRGSESVVLTNKEFALLEQLMLNRGSCLSRLDLLQRVWKMESMQTTNIVDVYVSLQQLISINETLQNATATGSTGASVKPSSTPAVGPDGDASRVAQVSTAPLNSTVPSAGTAAMRIATALTGR